jgi:hypothetical protein
MQPSAASTSSDSQRSDCENALAERRHPGAAWKTSIASSDARPPRMSQASSQSSTVREWTVATSSRNSPPRRSSPRIAGTPPARWTSSIR